MSENEYKIQLDEHTVEDYKAIKLLKDLGFTDKEIQAKYDKQKESDGEMTESEAIKELHEIRPRGGIIPQKRAEAIDVAIKALEKQIPKKPEYEADGYADGELVYDYAKCPVCGHDFEYGINDWGCNYCSDCGQKLDWSEESGGDNV